jgi:D-alanyl-D-alanine carboxypeptidase
MTEYSARAVGASTRIKEAVAVGAVAISTLAAAAPASAFSDAQRAQMEQEVQAVMQQAGYPGLLVGVWTEGEGKFISTPGLANTATRRQMKPDDVARIGSITKTMTATVILQLVEEGQIGLDDPVKTYLQRVPRGSEITIRMLLNHTSGIFDLPPGVQNASVESPHQNWRPEQLIFRGLRHQRVSPPGEQWHYSNIGYIMLGKIAEDVTGEPMRRLYAERIFEPLGLRHTEFVPSARMPVDAVHGYFTKPPTGNLVDTIGWNFSWAFTAGSMVSNLPDLHRYGPALAIGKGLLSKRMQRQRLKLFPVPAEGIGYGLGIFEIQLGTTTPINYLGHNGIVYGYDAILLYSPEAHTTIAIIGNTAIEEDNFPNDELRPTLITLADLLAATAAGQPLPE